MTQEIPGPREIEAAPPEISLPNFGIVEIIGNTQIRGLLPGMPSIPGKRVRNRWAEFSITDKEHKVQEPVMLQEPSLSELGIADLFASYTNVDAAMAPSEVSALNSLPRQVRLRIPLVYICRLHEMGILKSPNVSELYDNDQDLNKMKFGERTYLIEPLRVMGDFAAGKPSPRYRVFTDDYTAKEANQGANTASLFTFYGGVPESLTPEQEQAICEAFHLHY
jgi:hypothetical protein